MNSINIHCSFQFSFHSFLLFLLSLTCFNPDSSLFFPGTIFFSAPRIGNTVFAAFVNRKIPSNYRVEVDTDIITMIPKVLGLYRHAGIPVVIDSDEAGPECVANREI